MNLIVIGPQGSGKGEQATRLAKEFGLVHIVMGDILREIAHQKSELGRFVNRTINVEGKLLPDKITFKILKKSLREKKNKNGFVFDGYPRSLLQFKLLEAFFKKEGEKIDRVFYLEIAPQTTIKRLSSRRVCPKCKSVYNLVTDPPKRKGVCDKCGSRLIRRKDDEPEVIRKRLKEYRKKTLPLIAYFEKKDILEKINGEPPIEEVFESIKKKIKDLR